MVDMARKEILPAVEEYVIRPGHGCRRQAAPFRQNCPAAMRKSCCTG